MYPYSSKINSTLSVRLQYLRCSAKFNYNITSPYL